MKVACLLPWGEGGRRWGGGMLCFYVLCLLFAIPNRFNPCARPPSSSVIVILRAYQFICLLICFYWACVPAPWRDKEVNRRFLMPLLMLILILSL